MCIIVFWKPSRASSRLIYMSKYKLSPTRLNYLCGFCLRLNMRSPRARSGTCSPSRSLTIWSPLAIPFSISIVISELSFTNRLPLQVPHLAAIYFPLPPHLSQCVCICICMPNPTCTFCMTTPRPWHLVHVLSFPSFAPVPRHLSQYMFLLTCKVLLVPK